MLCALFRASIQIVTVLSIQNCINFFVAIWRKTFLVFKKKQKKSRLKLCSFAQLWSEMGKKKRWTENRNGQRERERERAWKKIIVCAIRPQPFCWFCCDSMTCTSPFSPHFFLPPASVLQCKIFGVFFQPANFF